MTPLNDSWAAGSTFSWLSILKRLYKAIGKQFPRKKCGKKFKEGYIKKHHQGILCGDCSKLKNT